MPKPSAIFIRWITEVPPNFGSVWAIDLRFEQGLLERLRRRDVRRGGAGANDHAQTRAGRDRRGCPACILPVVLKLGHQRCRGDDEIGRLARGDGVAQQSGRAGGEIEFDAGLLRIVVDHAADHAAHGAGGDHLKFHGIHRHRRQQQLPSVTIAAPMRIMRSPQAWPTSLDSMPGRMPIFCSALAYFVSMSVPNSSSGSAEQCSQPLSWISVSSWPGAQPA